MSEERKHSILAPSSKEWNPMNYVTYQPDDDGIIPVYPQLGMEDGLTARIFKLIKHIYGEDTYRENIDFIADALGKKNIQVPMGRNRWLYARLRQLIRFGSNPDKWSLFLLFQKLVAKLLTR